MPDAQINNPQAAGAPSDYTLPPSVAFVLKAVRAEFDGSGAAGAFLPCVTIVSDAGLPVADACDQAVEVAAGGSAQVSFFPGVKHAGAAAVAASDMYPAHEELDLFAYDQAGAYFSHWSPTATVDTACLMNGYFASDGAQGAFLTTRFSLGPQGAFHLFNVLWRAGPDGGVMRCYLASIPEDDPNYGATDNSGVLVDISTLSFVRAWAIDMYNPAVTRNQVSNPGFRGPVQNEFSTTLFRVGGQPGDTLTGSVIESPPGLYAKIDGGPGMYAAKLIMETKNPASSSYVGRLQRLTIARTDWAFA